MSREVQAAVLLVMGVVIGRLAFTDAHLVYVKGSLQIPLALSALVLVALGLASILRDKEDVFADEHDAHLDPHGHGDGPDHAAGPGPEAFAPDTEAVDRAGLDDGRLAAGIGVLARDLDDPRPDEAHGADHGDHGDGADGGTLVVDPHGHGHDHSRAPRIGMLMLVPILCLLLIAPAPLGSYAAARGGTNRVAAPTVDLGPLPEADGTGAVPMTVGDAVVRALFEPDGPMTGEPVRLVGFVAPEDELGGYRLSRFSVACCAADAAVRQVVMTGVPGELEDDTWVEVVAVFDGEVYDPDGEGGVTGVPVMRAVSQEIIEQPASPYEF